MSAPVPMNAPDIEITRGGLVAAAGVVIATCSVAVTLAVAGGGGAAGTDDPRRPGIAQTDVATPSDHGVMERRR
jgi:hypothetical protein